MKKISYLCSTCLITCSALAHADISSFHDNLLAHTESTLAVESPFLSSSQIKLAAVYPLSGNGGITFKAPKNVSCVEGQINYSGRCITMCDKTLYPSTSPLDTSKGIVGDCTDFKKHYGYTSCKEGWTLNGSNCELTDCSAFPLTKAPSSILGTVASCKSGPDTFYKYSKCNDGWELHNGRCDIKTCSSSDFPYTSNPGNNAGTVASCKTGEVTLYGYTSCRTGWDKSNGYCTIHNCPSDIYPFSDEPSGSLGPVLSCKTGNVTKYGYGSCTVSGYELENGKCVETCNYTDSSMPSYCSVADSCIKGGRTYYSGACQVCQSGYYLINVGNSFDEEDYCVPLRNPIDVCRSGWLYYDDDTCGPATDSFAIYDSHVLGVVVANGIVPDGNPVKVIALNKEGTYTWSNVSHYHLSTYKGWRNTYEILWRYKLTNGGSFPAAEACINKTTGGKVWYLPTRNELESGLKALMYGDDLGGGENFLFDDYWTSEEESSWEDNPSPDKAYALKTYALGVSIDSGLKDKSGSKSTICMFGVGGTECPQHPFTQLPPYCREAESTCQTGSETHYSKRCKTCRYGTVKDANGACQVQECTGVMANWSQPNSDLKHCFGDTEMPCRRDGVVYWGCGFCESDWTTASDGSCMIPECSGTGYTSSSIPHCSVASACLYGSSIRYECEKCNPSTGNACMSAYQKSNGSCVDKSSDGLTTTWCSNNCRYIWGTSIYTCPDGSKRRTLTSTSCTAADDAKCQTCDNNNMMDITIAGVGGVGGDTECFE